MSKLKYFDGTNWNEVNGNIVGDTLPIGAIVPFGGWDAPTGWLICDGTLLSKTTYPELFNAIGYSFGGEDGGSTFGLPDLRGRVPVGEKDSDSAFDGMGTTGGSKDAVVVAHYHSTEPISSYPGGNPGTHTGYGYEEVALSRSSYGNNTGTTGVSGTDKNLQPYQTVNYIIKAKQSAGVVANVSNTSSNSQVDTYSCNYINGIIESSANANGYYTKYADGTLICRYYVGPVTTNGNSGSSVSVTFPMAFINTDWQCVFQLTNGQNYWSHIFTSVGSKSTTGFDLQTWNNSEGQNSGQYWDYIAIGRWK